MKIEKIHHVAYRCMDVKTTVEFYQKYLNMDFVLAISEDKVPSTGEPDPYIHLFMDAGNAQRMDKEQNDPKTCLMASRR